MLYHSIKGYPFFTRTFPYFVSSSVLFPDILIYYYMYKDSWLFLFSF